MIQLTPSIRAFAEALAADADLTQWAQATYGRKQKIYINFDGQNPPGSEDCPYLTLRPEIMRIGNAQTQKMAQFEMVCSLYDESFRTYADEAIIEYNGVQNIVDFLQLSIRALASADLGNALLKLLEPAFETIEAFPYFMAGLPLLITEDYVLGVDRLAL